MCAFNSSRTFRIAALTAEVERLKTELLDTTWQDHADKWQKEATRLRAAHEEIVRNHAAIVDHHGIDPVGYASSAVAAWSGAAHIARAALSPPAQEPAP